MSDLKYVPIYLDWIELMQAKDTAEKQVAFILAIFDYALHGNVPPSPRDMESPKGTDYAARDGYLVAKRSLDFLLPKIRAGLASKGISRNRGNQNARKRSPENNTETKRKQYRNNTESANENNTETIQKQSENNTISISKSKSKIKVKLNREFPADAGICAKKTIAETIGSDITTDATIKAADGKAVGEDVAQSCKRPSLPTECEMEMYAANVGVPKGYIRKFLARMEELGWEYVNHAGSLVRLNRRNFKAILRLFYDNEDRTAKGRDQSQSNQPEGVVYQQEGYDLSDFAPDGRVGT